ncbi:MAG: FAD-binding oxidoreductase, partial [Alphaproteobacteria bacterium]|nr:FAD-binding oxidoreductase [Alphaproteobacteria bacterium]
MAAQRRKFWGWGFEGETVGDDEAKLVFAEIARRHGEIADPGAGVPTVDDFDLRPPRVQATGAAGKLTTDDAYERLTHAYGKSFPDTVRMFRREVPEPPDLVAYAESEDDVVALMDWADGANVAVIPFGGGTSVCGGVEPAVGDGYAGTLSLDLTRLDKVLEVDKTSRAARIQAGAACPVFEKQLKEHGLTLRHFPQSFLHATLGGMIATRSGGHYASLYTHIDDFVESTRTVTPAGIMESFRLPGSGAGPSPDRLMIGSEGILGIITEAWMRVQDLPKHRAAVSVAFPDIYAGAEAIRALSQAWLFPSNCRLLDAEEARNTGAGDGKSALLVLSFESADHAVEPWMARALELVRDHGGRYDEAALADKDSHRKDAAGAWRSAFIRMPYYREILTPRGVISDTFETSITWERFPAFHDAIRSRMLDVIEKATGRPGSVTCRFTHVYPDGPAPYFTFQGMGRDGALIE